MVRTSNQDKKQWIIRSYCEAAIFQKNKGILNKNQANNIDRIHTIRTGKGNGSQSIYAV
jgi:hypothetical protein